MSGPYFQQQSWSSFAYQGNTYDLTHLDEYEVEVLKGLARNEADNRRQFQRSPLYAGARARRRCGVEIFPEHPPGRAFLRRSLPLSLNCLVISQG